LAIVVSIEGWNAIANRSPQFDGCSFEFGPVSVRDLQYSKTTYNNGSRSSGMVTVKRNVADWVKCIIYRKDRGHPIAVTTYFDEALPVRNLGNHADANVTKPRVCELRP
jgi:RecT family.